MKEVHKMYIEVLEEEIKLREKEIEETLDFEEKRRISDYIVGVEFSLDKAKGILPL